MAIPKRRKGNVHQAEPDSDFVRFFRAEYPALIRSVYLIVQDREQARDITQEAFAELFSRWRRIAQYDRPDAWVRRIAIRMAVRAVRRERQRPAVEQGFSTMRPSESRPLDFDVLRAVAALPRAQKVAIVLFYFEDRPIAEVADLLGCSDVTAKVHLHRARKRLIQVLGYRDSETDDSHAR
jgi:RNA polymerase sigma-70 factor, ECF subfamily